MNDEETMPDLDTIDAAPLAKYGGLDEREPPRAAPHLEDEAA